MAFTAADYYKKVEAYFVATLGRPASASELALYAQKVADNNGNVWKAGLVTYLADQANYSANTPADYAGIVTTMYKNMTGKDIPMSLYNTYVGLLMDGTIKLKGLANAMINDLGLVPRADGTIGQPPGWGADRSSELPADAKTAYVNKVDVAAQFTAALDTPAEDQAFLKDPTEAKNLLSGVDETDASKTDAINNINTAVASTVSNAAATSGQTFTLTASADLGASFTGTDGNDVYSAGLNAGQQTLNPSDNFDAKGGTDKLYATLNSGTVVQPTISNLEEWHLTSTANNSGVSLLSSTGYNLLSLEGSTASGSVTNIGDTTAKLSVSNTSSNATFTYVASAVSGTSDAVSLDVNNVIGGTITINPSSGTNGVETINLASKGAANTFTLDDGASTSLSTLNVTGDQNLTLTTTPTTITTVDASGLTGALTYTANAANAVNITTGSGNDAITRGVAANDTISLGAGDDTVTFQNVGDFTSADTIDGGDGVDTLVADDADLTGYTQGANGPTVSNFEAITVATQLAAGLTVANIQSGIDTVTLNDANGQTITLEAGSKTVNLAAQNTGSMTISDTGTATDDTLTINNNVTAATDTLNGQAITVNGFETVTLNVGANATAAQTVSTIAVNADTGGTSTLNITGANSLSTTGAITANVIDASGMTGTAALTMGTAAVGVTTITGTANDDTLLGDASSTINGGAGDDTITGGTGDDTLNGDAGNDTITTNTGNDTVNGGAGDDVIVFAGNLDSSDSVDGGDGNDTLSITNATLTTLNGYSISQVGIFNDRVSGIEVARLTDALNQTSFDMARLDNIANIDLRAGWTGAETLAGLQNNAVISMRAGDTGGTNALTLSLADNTGTNDAITVNLVDATGGVNYDTIAMSGIESLTLTTSEATASNTAQSETISINATGLETLTLQGTESLDLTGLDIGATTIDASGIADATATTAPNVQINGSAAAQTITGSAGNDTINAKSGNDTVDGGAGNDTIDGGTGDDTITGGEGQDSITGGAGNDTINLAETTDAQDTVVFSTSSTNGQDTINGFNSSDILKITTNLLTGATALDANGAGGDSWDGFSTNPGTSTDISSKAVIVYGQLDATGLVTELNTGGAFANLDFNTTSAGDNAAVILVANSSTATTANIYYVAEDGTTAGAAGTATLVGVLNLADGFTIDGLTASNIA